ncbi:hypothetical protein ERO13_A03G019250v2 [Gossypium hirsutum]|uniref:Uncharacterized protein n=3 Tax=Gossypium TaxID=3633 RepID=A0A5D2ZSF9_GOSMU|nr:hypothetical protein ERO13_A03G019250v2 [Gossypium hirsutum]TYH23660.1 hypothetical protein ES288_A03G031400v1 [Gossypium darwinii]TYI34751.1 hypothetical protein ES332_A03G031100v1 [Gossypium tomentosum]TYJ41572.1 hypothetical protein E1A91_A03G031600v1 [Gossypium mustelinum]
MLNGDEVLSSLKHNLRTSQPRMKADQHQREIYFEERDWQRWIGQEIPEEPQ